MKTAPDARFTLAPRGPFSMDPVRSLACGFLLGSRTCELREGAVTLAFPLDGTFQPVAVRLSVSPETTGLGGRRVEVGVFGADAIAGVQAQVERMLALDHDATPYFSILEDDPVLRRLLAERPAFRPVVAASPYAMAGWCVLSHRIQKEQAAKLQRGLAKVTGGLFSVDGEEVASFPAPQALLELGGFAGIPEEKWRRLEAVARAALEGVFDPARLASVPYAAARSELLEVRGIGPWTADAVLIRGGGATDVLPLGEPTLHAAVRSAWSLPRLPSDAEVRERAEAWRPFRTWVSVLLISAEMRRSGRFAPSRVRPIRQSPRAVLR